MNGLLNIYHRLDKLNKQLLQIVAFKHDATSYVFLTQQAETFGFRQKTGRALTQSFVKELMRSWTNSGLLLHSNGKPEPQLMDTLIREGVSHEYSQKLLALAKAADRRWRPDAVLEFYLAFYDGDSNAWNTARQRIVDGCLPLLSPFCHKTWDRLPTDLQSGFFSFVIPGWIVQGQADPEALLAFRQWLEIDIPFPAEMLPRLLEWALASGDRALVKRLSLQSAGKMRDVEGCMRLLSGEFAEAFALISETVSIRAKARALTKLGGLPSLIALLGTLAGDANVSREDAFKATMAVLKPGTTPYGDAFAIAQNALMFMKSPGNSEKLISGVNNAASSPLAKWSAGYLQAWLAADAGGNAQIDHLIDAAKRLDASGCHWLAAETYAAAGRSKLKTADKQQERAQQIHLKQGTASLLDYVQPEPGWSRTLSAIALLGGQGKTATRTDTNATPTERLIYEITHNQNDFHLDVFHQVRKGSQWSKGRKVALSRLFTQHSTPEFAFLTPEDRALCQTLKHWTERGAYGYPEEHSEFETRTGARALIGHPRIFRPNDREQPLEIIEKPVSLIVRQHDDLQLELFLDPQPPGSHEVQFNQNGPHQIAITLFDTVHNSLQGMLGTRLNVPTAAATKVLETITQLAAVVTIHCEIGNLERGTEGETIAAATNGNAASIAAAQKIAGDPRTHLHLLPTGDGLRAELYVQPFGTTGPVCRPGEGGMALFATLDGKATSATRDLSLEVQTAQAVIDQCATLSSHLSNAWRAILPSPNEALELLLELEPLTLNKSLTVHWPKGRSLRLTGVASESMMRVRLSRDRNWFAASGELKIDNERSIDMLQLIELVSASPGRFIKMADGEFLALTSNLRQRIEDLRFFGDGRAVQGKLRFAAVHAGVLEDLGKIKVTSDTHWKQCLKRMREATEIKLQVPETFQAELRPYQQEGIAWLQRLAAWGVGGCLADDMGLGKTIQAIVLLLQRAADGPVIVIAPTSVIHNWQAEITRFAPTLRPRVLAESPRKELLDSLTASDVLLCSYGLMQNEIKQLEKLQFNTLILDEAQAIKNAATQRSKAVRRLSSNCRFLLTGTPMENHLGELWNLMDFVNPGLLGTAESFQSRFALPIERDGDRAARQGLKRLVAPFILRRTKAQVLTELPSRTQMTFRIEPSADEAAFYEALRRRAIELLSDAADGKPKTLQILGEIMRLRRACCHPKLVMPESTIESSKLTQVLETIDDLRGGKHRALIFSQFVDHLQLLSEQLDKRGIAYQYLDGSTPARTRKDRVDAFQAGEGDVFLISLKAGGTGLNLTAADYVIHLDPWWNPAVEDQASDRAHRIGQQRPVTIYRMVLAGTIEEKILELHTTKRDLAESLLEGTDRSGKLTTEELLQLIKP